MSHQNSVRQTPWRSVRKALVCVRRWRDLDPERPHALPADTFMSPPLLPNGVTLLKAGGGAVSEKMQLSVPVPPTTAHFTAHIKRQKKRGVLGTCHPRHRRKKKKDRRVPLALGQTIVLCLYYLWAVLDFQRTAVDMKQLINTQSERSFFIRARR